MYLLLSLISFPAFCIASSTNFLPAATLSLSRLRVFSCHSKCRITAFVIGLSRDICNIISVSVSCFIFAPYLGLLRQAPIYSFRLGSLPLISTVSPFRSCFSQASQPCLKPIRMPSRYACSISSRISNSFNFFHPFLFPCFACHSCFPPSILTMFITSSAVSAP